MYISIISPVYKGEKMIEELIRRITESVLVLPGIGKDIDAINGYEIILVNDQSPDNSWQEIERHCHKDKHVKGINLSRNFGQPYAITAGLTYSTGDYVVVLDCDLQNRPEEIPRLYAKAKEGFDIVYACRVERADSFMKKMSSVIFHKVYNYLSGLNTNKEIAEFGIYSRKVVDTYCSIPEYARTFVELIQTLGYNVSTIDVEHAERVEGESSYTLSKLLTLSFNAMISNTNKPLQLSVALGFGMSFFSLLLNILNIFAGFIGWNEVAGYTTTIFSIWFVGGLILGMMGILGLYIGKIFDQVKGRPIFIVKDLLNLHTNEGQK